MFFLTNFIQSESPNPARYQLSISFTVICTFLRIEHIRKAFSMVSFLPENTRRRIDIADEDKIRTHLRNASQKASGLFLFLPGILPHSDIIVTIYQQWLDYSLDKTLIVITLNQNEQSVNISYQNSSIFCTNNSSRPISFRRKTFTSSFSERSGNLSKSFAISRNEKNVIQIRVLDQLGIVRGNDDLLVSRCIFHHFHYAGH